MCARDQLIEFIRELPHHELCQLFQILDLAHRNLVYDTTDERLLMQQLMVTLWIATRGDEISERQTKDD